MPGKLTNPLQNENRKQIYDAIVNNPGLSSYHIRNNMDVAAHEHHLNKLLEFDLIEKHYPIPGRPRYYENGKYNDEERMAIDSLGINSTRETIDYLINNGPSTTSKIKENSATSNSRIRNAIRILFHRRQLQFYDHGVRLYEAKPIFRNVPWPREEVVLRRQNL